jgi:hypothetical protein
MKRWSARQLVALFLTVFVTVGMSLSVVQASDMALKMSVGSGTAVGGHNSCHGCPPGSSDNGMKAMGCAAICVSPIVANVDQSSFAVPMRKPAPVLTVRHAALDGRPSAPDPYPPRPTNID